MRSASKRMHRILLSAFIYLLLGMAAFIAYALPLELFMNMKLLFGGVFLLAASCKYRLLPSIVLTLLVHSAAVLFTDSDVTMIHTIEIVAVLALRRILRMSGYVTVDLLFWLLAAFPYVMSSYYLEYGAIHAEVVVYCLVLGLNGVFISLITEIIREYFPIFITGKTHEKVRFRIVRMIYHISLIGIIGMFLLFVTSSSEAWHKMINNELRPLMDQKAATIHQSLNALSADEMRALDLRGVIQLTELRGLIELITEATHTDVLMMDQGGTVFEIRRDSGFSGQWLHLDRISILDGEMVLDAPESSYLTGFDFAWAEAGFVQAFRAGPFMLFVRWPLSVYSSELFHTLLEQCIRVMYIALALSMLVCFIRKVLLRSMDRLILATTDIPDKVVKGEKVRWPNTRIVEIQAIADNFRTVSETLGEFVNQSRKLAYYDMLTGLPNRRCFHEYLLDKLTESAASQTASTVVMFIDLDRFKQINDTLGHGVGDELLKLAAGTLQERAGSEALTARLGGDEFVIVMPGSDSEAASQLADHILAAFSKPIYTGGHELYISASIGISIAPEDGTELDAVVSNADSAMYAAKEAGGNTYRFYASEASKQKAHSFSERMFIEFELRKALDSGSLTLYYQPVYDLHSGQIRSAEALLRWEHPVRGMIPPSQFIPIAECCGMMPSLGLWVLQEACRQNKAWLDEGLGPIKTAVNLSPSQFTSKRLVGEVHRIVEETGFPPHLLELEITEEIFIQNASVVVEQLQQLQQKGIFVWIDDFGTGYSSLSLLHQLPADGFKMDRSFIRQLPDRTRNDAVVRAIIQLAQGLGKGLIAEGVETEGEAERLMKLGCSEHQGFYYSQPLPPERFKELLRQQDELRGWGSYV